MSELEITIQTLRAEVHGDVCSRSRVIDALLDLRLEAYDRTDVVGLIDDALASCPGMTMVPAGWWRDVLDSFELVAINPVEPVA